MDSVRRQVCVLARACGRWKCLNIQSKSISISIENGVSNAEISYEQSHRHMIDQSLHSAYQLFMSFSVSAHPENISGQNTQPKILQTFHSMCVYRSDMEINRRKYNLRHHYRYIQPAQAFETACRARWLPFVIRFDAPATHWMLRIRYYTSHKYLTVTVALSSGGNA